MLTAIKTDRTSARLGDALRRCGILLALCAGLGLTVSGNAWADFGLDWYTIDGGGHTFSTGDGFTLGGTIGQPDAGTAAGGGYTLRGGFWLGGMALSSVEDPDVGPGSDPAHDATIPTVFRVILDRSNPFQHQTEIRLNLPEPRAVGVRVFDHSGRVIRRLHDGQLAAGYHRVVWDGTDGDGRSVPSGSYLMQVRAGDAVCRRRVVLIR